MALASQSIRSGDRRRVTMSQRRLLSPRLIGFVGCAVAATGLAWWLMHDRGDITEDTGLARGNAAALPATPPKVSPSATEVSSAVLTGKPIGGGRVGEQPRPESPKSEDSSLRSLVANDRTSGESKSGPAIEMSSRKAGNSGAVTQPTAPAGATNSAPPAAPSKAPTSPAVQPPPSVSPPTSSAPNAGSSVGAGFTANADLAKAFQIQATDPVQSRVLVTRALDSGTLSKAERERAYETVNALSKVLFLNTNINPNDPVMLTYTIEPGDSLVKIVRSEKLACETSLLKRLNGIQDERKLRPGQRLRVPRGTFHAEVIKEEFRLNLYLDGESETSGSRVMVASLRCGLGESNGTPTGLFKVRPKSKLIDPEWTHPKSNEHFASSDPKNPIGEHWIGIMGIEDKNKDFLGYGIHGTIEPESIGRERSLGCVRMAADDIALVYECLTEPNSTILIR